MIRDIAEKDYEQIARIYNYYIRETVVTFEETAISASGVAERVVRLVAAGFDWLIAEDETGVTGYAYSSSWKARAAYRHTAEVSVYLDHTKTGAGIGTALYQALFARLREKGFHLAIGGITLPNAASVRLHEKLGLTKVAHFKEVGYKFDQWLDVGYWQLELD